MRLILDFVPNHTSDRAPLVPGVALVARQPEARLVPLARPGARRRSAEQLAPNFGGPAWTFDERPGQYYYHAFLQEQPDLNWRNPDVRAAMHDVLRFWLDRGVDGFRVDVLWHLIKDPEFRDNPPNPDYREGVDAPSSRVQQLHSADHPDVHGIVAGMRRVLDEYPSDRAADRRDLPADRAAGRLLRRDLEGAHLPFNFQLIGAAGTPAARAS